MIKIKNLTVEFPLDNGRKYTALSNVSLEINDFDHVALIGRNGSGKYFFKNLTSLLFSYYDFSVVCSLVRNAGIFSTIKQKFNRFKLTYKLKKDYHCFNFPIDIHGACYGIKTDAVKKIAFLEEKVFPVGYGKENDYLLRLKAIRKSVVLSLSTYFIHYGNQSFGNENRNINKILGRKSLEGKHSSVIERYYANVHKSNEYIQKIISSRFL